MNKKKYFYFSRYLSFFTNLIIILFFFLNLTFIYSLNNHLPKGFNTLPKKVQRILLKKKNKIYSFKSNIHQILTIQQTQEIRKGYYIATSQGFFRADFYQPKESIIYNGKNIYWKIHPNPFTWIIQNQNKSQLPKNPIASNSKTNNQAYWLNKKYQIIYNKPSWWQFWKNEREEVKFKIKSSNNQEKIQITICIKENQICKRTMYDKYNRVIMREIFSKPILIKNLQNTFFYRSIKVIVYQYSTKLRIVNDTFYSNPVFNKKISQSIFQKPKGPFRIFKK